ncbi:beta-mannosidase [Cohnella rhizosphaerae]|uniref:Beta-mannosidase B n=1 Tax=Cohnella rhizosphaerae TaxID=1457232 RepID=A0A9X4QT29_9BACL|nr:sugar-binding domain-containing protein [Cohnella rhizosphaerae]MDG0809924.1 hypothetical protein [Cohnella rhizosphaerae]
MRLNDCTDMEERLHGALDLSGVWRLAGSDGQRGGVRTFHLADTDDAKWMEASVPGEVHLELIKRGLIEEPTEGLNALSGRWVEESIWAYRKTFSAPEAAVEGCAWLVFEGLDYEGHIYLNEERIGEHANFYRPCKLDVTGKLREENLLVVVLNGGLHAAGNRSVEGYYENSYDHVLHKRIWLRKPQSSFGWDWSARYVNVGIHKPARLEWAATARVDDIVVLTDLNERMDEGAVSVRVFLEGCADLPAEAEVTVRVNGGAAASSVHPVRKGQQRLDAAAAVPNPRLWWPSGHGEQPLYEIEVEVKVNGSVICRRVKRAGFRRLAINQDPHPAGGRYFVLEVNGKPVFAKGANFIPADMLFIRADRARYEGLIDRALEANFNFLRVWGGGVYESDDFYELCDERGVMVWQDFMFACAAYPTTEPAFMRNVKEEAIYNVRRLAHHPSLVMYCGNNENQWHTNRWDEEASESVMYPDYAFYHHVLPRIVREEDPGRYYQPSSPYSPDDLHPNDDSAGDQHPWTVGFDNTDFREYRSLTCRFPNEGGILGPTSLPAMHASLPDPHREVLSFAWQQHDNAVDSWYAQSAPDRQIREWTGLEPRGLSIEEHVYYGGLVQGEGLREYIDNFRRRMFDSASAIFWMFNDCWPATRSWTIVDYYLNRTPSFYPVKRAFQPVSVVVVREAGLVRIFGINETGETWRGELHGGLFTLGGDYVKELRSTVEVPANTSRCVAEFDADAWDAAGIADTLAFASLSQGGETVARGRLIVPRFREMNWPQAQIDVRMDGGHAVFTSSAFAFGVCIDLDGDLPLSDNFFDLWPGMPHRIAWPSGRKPPQVLYVGNSIGDRQARTAAAPAGRS